MLSRIAATISGRTALSSASNGSYHRLAPFLLPSRIARPIQSSEILVQPTRRSYATEDTTEVTTSENAPLETAERPRKDGRPKKAASETATDEKTAKKTVKKSEKPKKRGRPKTRKTSTKKKPATPKPRGRPKKPRTPEQVQRLKLSDLRKNALLKGPKMLPQTAYVAFSTEGFVKGSGTLSDQIKSIAEKYHGLSISEREHYNNIARANKSVNEKTMTQWIESHTPDAIRDANNARRALNRLAKLPKAEGAKNAAIAGGFRMLKDPRKITRAGSSFLVFTKERWTSGDLKGMGPAEAARMLSAEWKTISDADKQRYRDQFKLNAEQYNKDAAAIYTRGRKKPALKPAA